MALDKRTLISIGASLTAVILLGVAVSQCNQKNDALHAAEEANKNVPSPVIVPPASSQNVAIINTIIIDGTNCATKDTVKKPVSTKPAAPKKKTVPQKKRAVPLQNAGSRVELGKNAVNGGDILVVNGNSNGAAVVVLGEGARNDGNITVNNGGVINNNYNVYNIKVVDTVVAPKSDTVAKNSVVTYKAVRRVRYTKTR